MDILRSEKILTILLAILATCRGGHISRYNFNQEQGSYRSGEIKKAVLIHHSSEIGTSLVETNHDVGSYQVEENRNPGYVTGQQFFSGDDQGHAQENVGFSSRTASNENQDGANVATKAYQFSSPLAGLSSHSFPNGYENQAFSQPKVEEAVKEEPISNNYKLPVPLEVQIAGHTRGPEGSTNTYQFSSLQKPLPSSLNHKEVGAIDGGLAENQAVSGGYPFESATYEQHSQLINGGEAAQNLAHQSDSSRNPIPQNSGYQTVSERDLSQQISGYRGPFGEQVASKQGFNYQSSNHQDSAAQNVDHQIPVYQGSSAQSLFNQGSGKRDFSQHIPGFQSSNHQNPSFQGSSHQSSSFQGTHENPSFHGFIHQNINFQDLSHQNNQRPASQGLVSNHQGPYHEISNQREPSPQSPDQQGPVHQDPVHQDTDHQGLTHQGLNHRNPTHQGAAHQDSVQQGLAYQDLANQGPSQQGPSHESHAHQGIVHQNFAHQGSSQQNLGPAHQQSNSFQGPAHQSGERNQNLGFHELPSQDASFSGTNLVGTAFSSPNHINRNSYEAINPIQSSKENSNVYQHAPVSQIPKGNIPAQGPTRITIGEAEEIAISQYVNSKHPTGPKADSYQYQPSKPAIYPHAADPAKLQFEYQRPSRSHIQSDISSISRQLESATLDSKGRPYLPLPQTANSEHFLGGNRRQLQGSAYEGNYYVSRSLHQAAGRKVR